ncbi:MAG: AI-2E family transporter [Sandarakinorhabdus sp.]|nr:AI-2E family transporter [Sandarakinorhabdus sp.]
MTEPRDLPSADAQDLPSADAQGMSIADRLSLPRIHWAWLLLVIGFAGLFWAARAVFSPFVAGFILAYLLDPPAQRMERLGAPRWLAAVSVLIIFITLFAAIILASAPIIQTEVLQFIDNLPRLMASAEPLIQRGLRWTESAKSMDDIIKNVSSQAAGWLTTSLAAIVTGSLAFVNVLSFVVVTPLVAFYLLRDWPLVLAQIDSWWPRLQAPAMRALLRDANAALAGFVRGQSLVCLSLAVFYAAGWSLVGLNYAVVLGVLVGVLAFVPFVGVLFAVTLSLLVALGQYGLDFRALAMVAGVFVIGQVLESSVLTPNLIGTRIGLHPVWVLFAVFAGGSVAGLAGVFLAVPVAAVLGVVLRAALTHYRRSGFYTGHSG